VYFRANSNTGDLALQSLDIEVNKRNGTRQIFVVILK